MRRWLVLAVAVGAIACDDEPMMGGDLARVQIDLQDGAQCSASDTMTSLSVEVRIEGTDSTGTCTVASSCIDRTLEPNPTLTVDDLEDALRAQAPLLNVEADGVTRIVVSTYSIQGCDDFFISGCGNGNLEGTDGEVIDIPMDCTAGVSCPAPRSCN